MDQQLQRKELLEFISIAIDAGAKIDIHFCELKDDREKAKFVCEYFSEIVGAPIQDYSYKGSRWLKVRKDRIELTHHFGQDSVTLDI